MAPPNAKFEVIPHRGLITICTMVATLMQVLDSTIANVALPYMQGSLSTTSDQISWVLTSYIVAAAIMTAPVGWLSARFGRKNFFLFCLVGFTLTSMLCGVAQSLEQMVLFRVLQGICGAAIVPLSQAIMLDIYSAEQRGQAMVMWGMGVMVGPIIGPTLGGYLTDAYDWRWVFFINLPFGILAITGMAVFMPGKREANATPFDWTGFAALSLGIGALQLLLDRGGGNDWFQSSETLIEATLGGLGLYLFLVHVWLAEKPFISPKLFADVNYTSGFLLMFAVGIVLLASTVLLAPFLQTLGGYPVWQAGLLMAPRGVGTMIGMMVAGRLGGKVDPRLVMVGGIAMLAFSFWEEARWTPAVQTFTLTWVTSIQGFALGLVFIPLQMIAYATLAPHFRADATALFSLVRNVGSAIGVSIASFMLTRSAQIAHSQIADTLTPFNRMMQTGSAYLFWNAATSTGRAALDGEVSRQALAIAYSNDFMLMFWISFPTAALILLMRNPERAGGAGAGPPAVAHAAMD
jgi:DHA2 family multidrug resistance protein